MASLAGLVQRIKLYVLTRNEYQGRELRKWFARDFQSVVGMYSYGCFDPLRIPGPITIGRYCSFAPTSRYVNANHPLEALSTHPYFYERRFGVIECDTAKGGGLVVEDGAWIGHNATVTPNCSRIGRGSVIAAGAVVTKDVPPYAIVAGVPAQLVRYRFPAELQAAIEASKWWELEPPDLARIYQADPNILLKPTAENLTRIRCT